MLLNRAGAEGPEQATGRKRRRIALTVDVEALELRSKTAPVDKLIWGRFPEGDYGLERLMSLAEAHGAKLSMFLDYPEFYAYGDSLLDVGREIVRRGHDLNLHLHLDCLPPRYFAERGLPEGLDLNRFTDETARACVDDLLELHARVTSDAPSALRGGAYRYNAALLRALEARGIPVSSNYNPAAKLQPFALGPRRQFRWGNGVVELPIATQVGFLNRSYATHFNFNIAPFMAPDSATALANAKNFLERFYAQHGEDAVAVFVLHSWSLLRMDAGGEFTAVNPAAPERLAELLSSWSEFAEFVTVNELARQAETGALELDGPISFEAPWQASEEDQPTSAPQPLPADANMEPLPNTEEVAEPESVEQSPSELQTLRRRVDELELEQRSYRRAAGLLAEQLERTKETLSFRLGHLLIHAPKSWRGLRRLPAELLKLNQEAKRRRKGSRSVALGGELEGGVDPQQAAPRELPREPQDFAELAFRVFLLEGIEAAEAFAQEGRTAREQAFALTRLAKAAVAIDPPKACELGQRAYDLEPLPYRGKWLALLKYNCGELREPARLLEQLPRDTLKPKERERAIEIAGLARTQANLPRIPGARSRAYEPAIDSCLYVTGSALPFHVAGYTVRSQALIRAIGRAGCAVTAATRPGYPVDRGIELAEASHEHDGVIYRHSFGPSVRQLPFDEFAEAAAQALIELAKLTKPQLIHAASNHVNALPALLAARRLGVPFVYEVRGLWELTAATRHLGWEQTERFALQRDLEALVAREADQVFTLTAGLAGELSARGVPRERITVVPNCVDPAQFPPRDRDSSLASRLGLEPGQLTIVYAGSLMYYEGLDDLLRAVAQLASEKVDLTLLIAGDGEARDELSRLAAELGLGRRVRLLGRLPPEQVPALWSLADMAAFPRKPFRVCQLVSPLKPLEPMVMGLPIVVSDVEALAEMVRPGRTGLVHRAGDAAELAARLRELSQSQSLRRELGRAAREAVLGERTWDAAGRRVVDSYRTLCSSGRTGATRSTTSSAIL